MKIFLIPHPKDFYVDYHCPRGETIVREGLAQLNTVKVVDSPEDADYYILDHVPHVGKDKWNYSEVEKYFGDKLICIDWQDEYNKYLISDPSTGTNQFYLYFKRSWCWSDYPEGVNQICKKHPCKGNIERPDILPISYAVMDCFPRGTTPFSKRKIDLGCYLRPTCPNRATVLNLNSRLALLYVGDNYNIHCGEVSRGSRSVGESIFVDPVYFEYLSNTKLLVTCNPTWWHGDSRLWEGLSAGCLVFTDTKDPTPPYLEDKKHLVYYDIHDLPDLRRKIKYYLEHQDEAEVIAKEGQRFALQNHTSKARMERVISEIWLK